MVLTADDRIAIAELVSLHGHLVDDGEFGRLDELFTADVVYDATDFGVAVIHGTASFTQAAYALGAGNPVGHHVTNVVVTQTAAGTVQARSKGIGVNADGTCGSTTYVDTVVMTPHGWRIAHRTIHARKEPLNGAWR